MKRIGFLACGLVLIAAAWQSALPDPLQGDIDKLAAAKSLKVTYTLRVVGEAPGDYKLTLSKPNLFDLETPTGFVISDGSNVYSYTKATNTYTKAATDDPAIAAFLAKTEVTGWAAFFSKKPADDFKSATGAADKTVKGVDVHVVDFVSKDGKVSGSLFIDEKLGVVRGYSLKKDSKDYLALADNVVVGTDVISDDKFAFNAPAGATMAAAAQGEFGPVQTLLSANCMPCHSADNHRAGLNLTSYEGISAAVTAGDAANSLLVKSLYGNGVDQMPKGRDPLSADQIKVVEKWVNDGAKRD